MAHVLCAQRQPLTRFLRVASIACNSGSSSLRVFSTQPADEDGPTDGAGPGGSETASFSISRAAAPYPMHQLIGDPRTGIADDTTGPLFGEPSIELVWTNEENGARFYRHSIAGRELPYMYLDSRLSDHSKNLLYLLRAKDPERWTIEALADKFQIRRQRVLAILALKDMEAAAMESGRSLGGPLSPYAYTIDLDDVHLDPQTGEPLDLAVLVARQQQQQHQDGASGNAAGSSSSSSTTSLSSSQEPLLMGLEDFVEGAASSSTRQQLGQQQTDLGVLMPQVALTAQRLQAQLLQLLQQHGFSIQRLQQQLAQSLDQAEAFHQQHIAGTPLEQLLIDAAEAAAGSSSPGSTASSSPAAADGNPAEAAEGAAAAATPGKPIWLDFEHQRQLQQQLLELLQPLLQLATAGTEQQGAQLASQLRQLLQQVGDEVAAPAAASTTSSSISSPSEDPAASTTAAAATSSTPEGAAATEAAAGKSSSPAAESAAAAPDQEAAADSTLAQLRAAAAAAPANVLLRALRSMDVGARRQLLELLPEVKAELNVQGADLRSLTDGSSSTPLYLGGSMPGSACPELPTWPGQVTPLVDVFGYEDIPRKALMGLMGVVEQLQQAAEQREAAFQLLAGGSGEGSSSAQAVTVGSLQALLDIAESYVALNVVYDKVINEQAAAAAGSEDTPPLPAASQRRMLRILREVDPRALEKVMFWEGYAKEAATNSSHPKRLRKMRQQIQTMINRMNKETLGEGEAEYPDLPDKLSHQQPLALEEQRYNRDLVAAWLDAEVVGRQYHKGSGDRHFVRLQTAPKFEGYSLEEFDRVKEGELSELTRRVTERQDDMMWREFKERFLYNMGLAGQTLFDLKGGHGRPQRPQQGWDWVIHPQLKSSQRRQQQELGQQPQERFVMQPDGTTRPLNEAEEYLVQRRTPKPRRRWFASSRRARS